MSMLILAARNLWRNSRRSLITIAGIAGGLGLLLFTINFQQGSYNQALNNGLRMMAGHLVVQDPGYQAEKDEHLVVQDSSAVAEAVRQALAGDPSVRVYRRVSLGGTIMSPANTRMAGLLGVEPAAEAEVGSYDDKLIAGEWLSEDDARGILLGERLAASLGLELGDRLVYQGEGAERGETVARMFRVRGIFKTGTPAVDGFVALTTIDAAQELLAGTDPAHQVAVFMANDEDLDTQVPAVQAALATAGMADLAVLDWKQALPEMIEFIEMDRRFADMMWFVLGLMVAFAVLNTVLMGVLERTREFGVMMALGMAPVRLAALVVTEALIMGLIGVGIGFVLGVVGTWPMVEYGWDLGAYIGEGMDMAGVPYETHIFSVYDWGRMGLFAGIGLLFSTLASLWPAWMVVRLEPVEAMHPQ